MISYEIIIRLRRFYPGACELFSYVLKGIGIPAENLAESDSGLRISVYTGSAEKSNSWYRKIKKLNLKNVDIDRRSLRKSDWWNTWDEKVGPILLTPSVRVMPVGRKKTGRTAGEDVIYLNFSYAFGTGSHPTTRMMAELIYSKKGKFNTFFDIGTGTGILSIMASKAGASKIWSIDKDEDSVKIAGYNFKVNNCCIDYLRQVDFGDFKARKKFDFIAANLLTADLIKLRRKIISYLEKGGYLSVSGILESNYNIFRKNFCGNLRRLKVKSEGGWKAVLYKKPFSHP
ncbi:MAG: methyltransferase domain-containing protein [Candidatus Omnitrophica bacterium]|nr:methyltransferase domain-containing protein [Candidatus Omnitrophota bacterium]MBD3269507.1 methyltransferase domain-containing protein [Candidatus Omnitrophota bacterium]